MIILYSSIDDAEMSNMSRVKQLRTETGLSQRLFAEHYGIPVRTLQQWEQEIQSPPAYVVELLSFKVMTDFPHAASETGHKYLSHDIPERKSWKICIPDPFPNCEKIHPLQQQKVKKIYDAASGNPIVNEIIIFGSSISSKCHLGSDVDVYMNVEKDINPLNPRNFYGDFEYDLFTNFMTDERLLREIKSKGVKVYGK